MVKRITARYVLTEDDLIAAVQIHGRMAMTFRRRFAGWLSLAILLGASFVALPSVLLWDDSPSKRASLVPILAVVLFGWFLAWVARSGWKIDLRRSVRETPDLERDLSWTIDDLWLSLGTSLSEVRYRWDLIKRVVEAPSGFLIYPSTVVFKLLPNHAFSSAGSIRQFADLARAKVANYVVLGECRFPAEPEPIGLDEL